MPTQGFGCFAASTLGCAASFLRDWTRVRAGLQSPSDVRDCEVERLWRVVRTNC